MIIAIFVCNYLYVNTLKLQQISLITKSIDTYNSSNSRYLGKYEIDKGYYILACKVFYNFHDSRIILYTYNANQDIVTSSLLVGCHDNSLTIESEYKNGIIDIETTYKKVPNGLDPPKGREYIQKKYKKQYHINKNFCFAEYK